MLQRAVIAMALACEPEVLIADEPTTALDVTIQAQILDLMRELQQKHGTSVLLITHDLGVVAEVAADVAIMYAGRIVERGPVAQVLDGPQHPYTQGLLASLPTLADTKARPLAAIEGTVPGLAAMPAGCRFHPRCPHAQELCEVEDPPLQTSRDGTAVACHLVSGRIRE
jgi:oligopeptide/dipeptide ABC transporter ATP-binding protein